MEMLDSTNGSRFNATGYPEQSKRRAYRREKDEARSSLPDTIGDQVHERAPANTNRMGQRFQNVCTQIAAREKT